MSTLNLIAAATLVFALAACDRTEPAPEQISSAGTEVEAEVADQCAMLQGAAAPHTTISDAKRVEAGAFVAPAPSPFGREPDYASLHAFCRVTGSIAPTPDSDIRFELWLPLENWNGRFLQTGNGGAAGSLAYGSLVAPLAKGYAVAHTDTGHRGGPGDFSWAPGHPERMIDYQYRAVHELTVVGKALTETYYGRAPEKAYWFGCSTGGRQGLKEVQRFPDDYDAVIAGAPANNWSPLMSLSMLIERELKATSSLTAKLGMLRDAAVTACDGTDGVVDGVITSVDSCSFDPGSLQCTDAEAFNCLTADEVAAARSIYAGVVDGEGQVIMPGTGPGSERAWAAYASEGFRVGSNYFRNVVATDPSWTVADFDAERDTALADAYDNGAAKAMEPDISAFVERGGRLLLYHGTTDGLIPYRNTVNYYTSVIDTLGSESTANHVKLFLVPGMDHCGGGRGAYEIDWLTAMEQWVEHDGQLQNLTGHHPESAGRVEFSRPLCAYPETAEYVGAGDVNRARSYACRSSG